MPDPVLGQAVVAYVKVSDPKLTVRDLVEFAAENDMLSAYKKPRYYRIVDKLPYTATGKKQHNVMKVQAEEDQREGRLKRS
ncbi:MAG: hypothetical protein LUD80_02240 [Clostridiales bacterium]|nr:hypothetical protein [Clostridiales bacterium]